MSTRKPNYQERLAQYDRDAIKRVISAFKLQENSRIIKRMKEEEGKDKEVFFTRMRGLVPRTLINILYFIVPEELDSDKECKEVLEELLLKTDPDFINNIQEGSFSVKPGNFNQIPAIKVITTTYGRDNLSERQDYSDV